MIEGINHPVIISAFPGTGKTYFANDPSHGYKVMDSDSSQFSWLEPGVRNPDFPANYIGHIRKSKEEDYDFILVSSHKEVREAMHKAGICFIAVYPKPDCKMEYIRRYRERGSSEAFINLIREKWEEWIIDMRQESLRLELWDCYLSDALNPRLKGE